MQAYISSVNQISEIKRDVSSCIPKSELIEKIRAYDPSVDEDLVSRAYDFTVNSHGDQPRHSGDPYYSHPIAVAGILTSLHMDVASVCTAMLHDTLEDTDVTYADLEREFGKEIADLVDGVTKLGQVELSSAATTRERRQAENFQKFVLHMSRDVRVLLVKLCDRLHNMRTLRHHPKPESRVRIAKETMNIYAPLARRIGVDRICSELEDLSFKYIDPKEHEVITRRLAAWRDAQAAQISEMSSAVRDLMDRENVTARVYGREKRAYAIWRKLTRQGITFEDVADIYAFRIIVENKETCYRVLGVLHSNFRCVPARFRDFISVPKANGYQSLHTTILGPGNTRIEVQIRSERMEDIAERGVAAHWSYKNNSYAYDPEQARAHGTDPLERLRPFVEMMEQSGDADEFLEHAKLEMFADQVFTFTPKGDLISLPKGATPLDFAYAVHTDVGDTCIGAVINSRQRPLRTRLQNGDVVKIIRGGTAEPQPDWESMVVTGKARSAIKRLARSGESQEFQRIGEQLVQHAFAREKRDYSESSVHDALPRLSVETVEDLYEKLGSGRLSLKDFMNGVFPGRKTTEDLETYQNRALIDDSTAPLYVKGHGLTPGISLHFADCCSPIPGDRIVGIQDAGKGIVIHTIDCETLETDDAQSALWLDIAWRKISEQASSSGRITATLEHVPGALADVTKIIGEAGGNLTSINTMKRSPTFFDMEMQIDVRDNRHLSHIIAALRTSTYVVSVNRTRVLHET